VYWDSCTFIGLLNREPSKVNACADVWDEAQNGHTLIYTSYLAFTEVFKVKCSTVGTALTVDQDKQIEQVLMQKWIRPVIVDERTAISARRLLRSHSECKKPADGIHLATALILNVDEMHTFDKSDLLRLNGKVLRADGKMLKICLPSASQPPTIPPIPDDLLHEYEQAQASKSRR